MALYQQLTEVCAKGGFRLNKWISNNRTLLSAIHEENRAKGVNQLDFNRDQLPMKRALGVQWNVESDTFNFSTEIKPHSVTRRGILPIVSSLYDPLGFVAPVILPAKQILQQLYKLKIRWDETIPLHMSQSWQRWLDDLSLLSTYSVNRCFITKGFEDLTLAELHHFCDASETGFGAVSYL